jgi:cholesterol transport system auxiliary component
MKCLMLLRSLQCCATMLTLVVTSGCGGLLPKPAPQPTYYTLDAAAYPAQAIPAQTQPSSPAPTLVINPPRAASGYDSQRIIYLRQAHRLEYFAHNQWIDTPAPMLAPLLVAAIESTGKFDAVLLSSTGARGDLRLDSEILTLHQDFSASPSAVRLTLRAYLIDSTNRRALARRDFTATVAARSDDPYGGVVAANAAVHSVLEQLSAFCADASAGWQSNYRSVPQADSAYDKGVATTPEAAEGR